MRAGRCPLVLLPGSLCDARLFGPLVSLLRDRSSRVGNIGFADSIAGIAAQVLRHAPPRFALAGLSMGGIVGLEVWRQAPSRVAGLALLDSTFAAEAPDVAARRSLEIDYVRRTGTAGLRRLVRGTYVPRYFAADHADASRLCDLVVQMASACGPGVFFRQWNALMSRPDSRATLGTIDCPSLVLCGTGDQLCPPAVHEEMAAAIGVECHVLERCGHLSILEAPRPAAAHVEGWLRAVDGRAWEMDREPREIPC